MTDRELMQQALDALEANSLLVNGDDEKGGLVWCMDGYYSSCFDIDPINKQTNEVITALRERLAQPEQEPVAWTPIEQPYLLEGKLDILMGDGSILCGVIPQEEGDLWWSGTAEKFIDPQYYDITHWRIHCDTAAIRARGQA